MFIIEPVEEAKIGSDQSIRPAKTWGLPRAVEFGQNVRGGAELKESYYQSATHQPSLISILREAGIAQYFNLYLIKLLGKSDSKFFQMVKTHTLFQNELTQGKISVIGQT